MSKFLKVIVNLFLVFAILVAGAILVPPILGVSTTMIDSASMDTNLPVGSITYSQNESVTNIVAGDNILIESDNRVYVYVVESADAVTGKFVVSDETGNQTEPEEYTLRNEALKVVLTVPLIGYIMVAMHSMEGLIIIGLVVLFVIILFILSELWKKSDDEEEEESEEEQDAAAAHATEAEAMVQETADANAESSVLDEKATVVSEETVSESVSDELVEIIEGADDSEAEECIREEADIDSEEEQDEPLGEDELEEALEETSEEEEQEEAVTFVKVPRPTLDEILVKAEAAGDKPEVVSYDTFGITVVDYSNCI